MKNAISSVLTGIGNTLSSKRVALFLFIFMFLGEHVMWYVFGKAPQQDLRVELFTLLLGTLTTIFGEPMMNAWMSMKGIVPPKLMPDPPQQ